MVEFIKRVQKKPKNTCKNINYHAGLRCTKGQNGGWHEESSLYLRKDGTEKFSSGNVDLTQHFVPKDQLADLKEDGKMISTNSQKTEEEHEKAQYELKNNRSWMNENKRLSKMEGK